jgi:hypothetical protein
MKVLEPNTGQLAHMEMDGVKKFPKNTSRRCGIRTLIFTSLMRRAKHLATALGIHFEHVRGINSYALLQIFFDYAEMNFNGFKIIFGIKKQDGNVGLRRVFVTIRQYQKNTQLLFFFSRKRLPKTLWQRNC